jgi:subtilisin-like proprotein convertase family protein
MQNNTLVAPSFIYPGLQRPIHALLGCMLFILSGIQAQQVTFNGTGGLPIPPGAPGQTVGVTQSTCEVSGVGIIDGCVSIDNVTIDLQHTWVGDIGILLIGPGGQVLELSTGNGGSGNDYTGTVFTDQAGDFITAGAPPYAGTFKPEGRVTTLNNPYSNGPALGTHTFASTYNGTNADGTWTLYINDYVAADVGEVLGWSITFNTGGEPPVADAGPDITTCTGQAATLTATGGGTYSWSTGETTASISVTPSAATTYTVTVTSAGCGTDTDQVLVSVSQRPTVTFTSSNPNVCAGGCTNITANFTGLAPFTLTYSVTGSGESTQTFATNTAQFQVCLPVDTPPGAFQIQATALTDTNCTCN